MVLTSPNSKLKKQQFFPGGCFFHCQYNMPICTGWQISFNQALPSPNIGSREPASIKTFIHAACVGGSTNFGLGSSRNQCPGSTSRSQTFLKLGALGSGPVRPGVMVKAPQGVEIEFALVPPSFATPILVMQQGPSIPVVSHLLYRSGPEQATPVLCAGMHRRSTAGL